MRRLMVINADDLGYSSSRDDGIFRAFREGWVTSATLLVNAHTSAKAAQKAVEIGVPLGLHLNLTEGIPVSSGQCSTLVDASTGVFLGKMGFREACHQGRISEIELKAEILAQIQKFRELTGQDPTHIDGHQHCHILGSTRKMFVQAMQEAGVPLRTRLPLEAPLFMGEVTNATFLKSVIQDAYESRLEFDQHGLIYPQCFMGLTLSSKSSFNKVWSSLMSIPMPVGKQIVATTYAEDESSLLMTCEWMVHPGLREPKDARGGFEPSFEPDGFAFSLDRMNEVEILCDKRLLSVMTDYEGLSLGSFKDLLPLTRKSSNRTCCILTSATPLTGNQSTALRIRSYLVESGWDCLIADANEIHEKESLDSILSLHQVDVVLGIHAYRSGKLLIDTPVPFIIVLGGTDMNEMIHSEDKRAIMHTALEKAHSIVAFGTNLADKARSFNDGGASNDKIVIVPQSVVVPSPVHVNVSTDDKNEYFRRLCESHQAENPRSRFVENGPVLLLPLGIRPVKDPLFVLEAMQSQFPQGNLVIVGPELDVVLSHQVKQQCGGNVWYVGAMLRDELLRAMCLSDAVINTSLSEGMSNTILEAMTLKLPLVIARDIEGNRTLVEHGVTGLLFFTPQEFVALARDVLLNPRRAERKHKMVQNAFDKVQKMGLAYKEKDVYVKLLENAVHSRACVLLSC